MSTNQTSVFLTVNLLFAGAVMAMSACGSSPAAPPATPAPVAETEDDGGEEAAGGADGQGGDSAEAADNEAKPAAAATTEPVAEPPPRRSGRPAIQYGPAKKIETTFGSTPAAMLKLKAKGGVVTLKIPEFALSTGTNITWKIATGRAPTKRQLVGSVCELLTTIAGKLKPSRIDSDGPKFSFRFPTGGRDTVNLAVGVSIGKTKYGREEFEWTVYAPTRVDTGFKEAHFELSYIAPSYIHATTAAPTSTDDAGK